MSRLIDGDYLSFEGRHYNSNQIRAILDFMDKQPTKYDLDSVLDELKRQIQDCQNGAAGEDVRHWNLAIFKAIEIVERGGIDGISSSNKV